MDHSLILSIQGLDSSESNGLGDSDRIHEMWSGRLYNITVFTTSAVLIALYLLTLYKACTGTSFLFIMVLTVLLISSNIGAAGSIIYAHYANVMLIE
jgi:uncharacterized membrane protein